QHPVRRQALVVVQGQRRRQRLVDRLIELDPGVVERLQRPEESADEERHQRDRQVAAGDPAHHQVASRRVLSTRRQRADLRHQGPPSTITRPDIVWCPLPQYSWQTIRYSPGRSKTYETREICPGSTMTLTVVWSISSPWVTSRLATTKSTFEPAGTRISRGFQLQTWATITAWYSFGAIWVRPGWLKGGVCATRSTARGSACPGRGMPPR